jgi:signal transduction histidine kinase
MPGSVRARTTAGATIVVAAALVVAGLLVVLSLRADLVKTADLEAEVAARRIASQVAAGVPATSLDLPDDEDEPVQVVGPGGRVVAQSEGLSLKGSAGPTGSPSDDDDETENDDLGEVSSAVRFSTRQATVAGSTGEFRFAAIEASGPEGGAVTVHAGAGLSAADEAIGATVRGMLLGLPLVLLVVAGATWLVTRRALRPVEEIRAEMAEITAAGDLARRVPVPAAQDEIARLATTTNRTLAALEASAEQQRRFIADASHELRNPIASLRTQLEVAVEHPALLDLPGTVADVERLQQLAADLLLLARLDAREPQPAPVPVDLAELVRDGLRGRPGTVGFDLRREATVTGRPRGLTRVLANLLDNAQRHAASAVTVTLTTDGGDAVLQVRDDGPGVPEEARERIFGRFARRDDARARDDGGAGLGLSIAREIAEAHAGTLRCLPPGNVFELRLPRVAGTP